MIRFEIIFNQYGMKYNTDWYIMQKHIFKEYDIRGIVGKELLIDHVEKLTKAILSFYKKKKPEVQRVAVAMDGRLHSDAMYQAVSKAITQQGLHVYFLGVCPISAFHFGLYHLPVQAGIMITGSHFSKEYNGFKLYLDKEPVWGNDIQRIYQLFLEDSQEKYTDKVGKIFPTSIIDQYVESLWQEFSYLSQYDFSVIIDCAQGPVGPVLKKLIHKMGWKKVETIGDIVDGSFSEHDPNPCNRDNMNQLFNCLKKNKGFFGIGFDGCGGRMIGMEDNGSLILGDRLLALFAQDILQQSKEAMVVYDVKSSVVIQEVVKKYHGQCKVAPSGTPLIQQQMKNNGGLLAGELSGFYFFKDRHVGYFDGIYAMLRLLDILVKERKSLYELLQDIPKKYSSYEIRIPCTDEQKHIIVQKVFHAISLQKKWKISQVDGIRVENEQSWGVLRASRTEPVVSLRCEGKNKNDFLLVQREFTELLKEHIKADILKKCFLNKD